MKDLISAVSLALILIAVSPFSVGATEALKWDKVRGSYVGACNGYTVWLDLYGYNKFVRRTIFRGQHLSRIGTALVSGNKVVLSSSGFNSTLEYGNDELEGSYRSDQSSGECDYDRQARAPISTLAVLDGVTLRGTWNTAARTGSTSVTFEMKDGRKWAHFVLCRGNTGSGCWPKVSLSASVTQGGYIRVGKYMLFPIAEGNNIKLTGWSFFEGSSIPTSVFFSAPMPK